MAQTTSIYNAPLSGNLGNMTYKNYNGKQVVTTRFRTTSAKGEGASRAQRMNRMLLPNLTLIASAIRDWLPAFWEETKQYSRPYNAFIATNMHRDIPPLSKQNIANKFFFCGKLQFSKGSLPQIRSMITSDFKILFDLRISSTGSINGLSWGLLSKQIIELNPAFKEGDSIAFIRVDDTPIDWEHSPSALHSSIVISGLILDTKATTALERSWHGTPFMLKAVQTSNYGNVMVPTDNESYSWAVVHISRSRGKYLCSTQNLMFAFETSENYEYMISYDYISECAASWGYKDKVL